MSFPDWGDVPTWGLFGGAVVTAVYAILAFRKQSKEVSDQASLLKIQSDRLDAEREQLRDQQALSKQQTEVLRLQAQELTESLAERKREAEEQRRGQAGQVAAWFGHRTSPAATRSWGAFVRNESPLPVYNVRVFFSYLSARHPASEDWAAVPIGGPADRDRVMPPRSEQFIAMPENVRAMSGQTEITDNAYGVSIEFADAWGNRWERNPRGALRSLDTAG
jgi:gas vesicle protein